MFSTSVVGSVWGLLPDCRTAQYGQSLINDASFDPMNAELVHAFDHDIPINHKLPNHTIYVNTQHISGMVAG